MTSINNMKTFFNPLGDQFFFKVVQGKDNFLMYKIIVPTFFFESKTVFFFYFFTLAKYCFFSAQAWPFYSKLDGESICSLTGISILKKKNPTLFDISHIEKKKKKKYWSLVKFFGTI